MAGWWLVLTPAETSAVVARIVADIAEAHNQNHAGRVHLCLLRSHHRSSVTPIECRRDRLRRAGPTYPLKSLKRIYGKPIAIRRNRCIQLYGPAPGELGLQCILRTAGRYGNLAARWFAHSLSAHQSSVKK
jgi:hypothetical protein